MIIRNCKKNERVDLKNFIHTYWKKNHILSKNDKLLDWLFLNNNHYNWMVGKKDGESNFDAILGYNNTSLLDKNLVNDNFTWLSIWQSKIKNGFLGLLLLKELETKIKKVGIGAIGCYESVIDLYKKMNYKAGYLNHYFILNTNINNYKIAKNINHSFNPIEIKKNNKKLVELDKVSFNKISYNYNDTFPRKSKQYFINRYFNHPFYNYRIFSIRSRAIDYGFIVIRKCKYKNNNVLRIIDFVGQQNSFNNLTDSFIKLMNQNKSEYIDFYCYGLQKKFFFNSGFKKKKENEIIPEYFEPFERKNISIPFVIKLEDENDYNKIRIFKGDGDQDRPNLILD